MNHTMRCVHCRCLFVPNPRAKPQRFCANKACQRARKAQWQREKMAADPDYRATKETANTAGKISIPSTGANIAKNARITATATGCCNSTGTTSVVAVRWQRWTRQRLYPSLNQVFIT
jgi:hypothetical protein